MADFKIRLSTEIDEGKSTSQLESLKTKLEKSPIKLKVDFGDLSKQIKDINSAMKNAFRMDNKQLSNLKSLKTTLQEINKLSKQTSNKLFGGDSGATQETKQLNTLIKKYDQLMSKKRSIEKQLSNIKVGNLTGSQAKEIDRLKASLKSLESFKIDTKDLTKSTSELSQLENKLKEVKNNLGNLNINMNIDKQLNTAKTSVDGLITKLQTLGKTGFGDTNKINETVSKVQTLKNELSNLNPNSENFTSEFQRISESINQCENEYKQLNSAMQQSKSQFKFETNLNRTLSDLQQLRQRCIDLGQSTSRVDALEQQLKELGNVSTDKATTGLQRIKSEMATMKSSMSGLGTATTGVQKTFSNLYSTMTTFSLGNILAQQIQKGVYSIGTTITELDSAFRDFSKVAPDSFSLTSKNLDELRDKAVVSGQEVAKSSVDIIESTANALQSGFKNVDDALKYAKESAKFSNVSDMSQEDTDKALRSILSSYGGVENSLKGVRTEIKGASSDYSMLNQVMDVANHIGNNYSTSTQSVAEGMQTAGASLKTMGTSVTDGMAYFAAIDEIMQNSGKSANGLKAIAQNMTGINVSAKDGSLSLNKSAKALKVYADIDVKKPSGELRDMGGVLDELGGKWETLNKTQKQALMVAIGGKLRSSQFSALMDNWETVKKIQQEVANGDALGSADKENQRYIDSIEGRVVKLKEELKKLVTTTISTDMFKGMVSGLTGVFSTINNVISAFDKLGVATPVVLSGLTGMFMTIKSLGTGTQLPNFAKTIGSLATSSSSLNTVKDSLKNTSTQFTTLSAGATKYSGNLRVASSSSEKFNSILKNNGVVAKSSANGMQLISKNASNAKSTLSGLGSSLSTIGSTLVSTLANTAVMAGVGIAISLAAQAWYDYAHAAEIAMQKHEENINKINTKISELNSEKSGLKSIAKEYDELAKKTNKTAEETERYNELRNQIAELSPDLVAGTDSDNNAILSLNGSLENYIGNLDSAIKKQKELLMQQQNAEASDASDYLQKGGNVAFGYDYRNYEKSTKVAKEEQSKIEKSGAEVTNSINRFTAASENAFDSSMERIRTARENHTQQIEDSYNKVVEEQEKINEYSSKLKQKALNKVEGNTKIEKANDDIKSFAKNVTSSLDFSSLKTGQIDTFARNLSNALGDGEIDGVLLKYQNLRAELERTGDTFTYENSIKSLIPEMSDLLGLNEEIVSSMLKLDPTLTQATSSLDSYLQSFGKRESMRGFDVETENLAKQYETFSTMMDDLGNLDASKDANGEVRFELSAVAEIVNQEDVPKQVQDLFSQMQQDGQFTDEEMEVMMRISAGMTTEDSGQRKELLDQAQQLIDELFPDNKIDIGQLDVEAEYQLNQNSKKDLADQIGAMGDEEFVATIKANVENYDQVKMYQDAISNLEGEKGDIQNLISANIENFGDMQSYEEIVAWLLEHPEIANKYNVSVVGVDTVDAVSKKVNELDLSKKEKKQIMVEIQEGDVNGLQDVINSLPEEKRIEVVSEISQALLGLDTVDAIELRDKIMNLITHDGASPTVDQANSKPLNDKNNTLSTQDGASPILDNYNLLHMQDKESTISVKDKATGILNTILSKLGLVTNKTATVTTYYKSVGSFGGGSGGGHFTQSTGEFSNISDTPTQASEPTAMSTGFSNVSATPTASPVSSSTPSASTSSGQVSAKAKTSPIDTVFTSPTKATKISTSLKHVWATLKYGINLFQELENRIKRVSNNVELLNSKMEHAGNSQKISYLKQQNKLYKEQASLTKTLYNSLNNEKNSVYKKVKEYGFKANSQGNISNYDERLAQLEKAAADADKKASNYKGKSKKTKSSLEKSADKASEKLENAKKAVDEYTKLQIEKIPDAKKEWQELQNAIKENNDEIEKLSFEQKIYKEKNAIDKLNASITQYKNYAERSEIRADNTNGVEKIKNLKSQLDYTKELVKLNNQLITQSSKERGKYKNKLREYGAKFDINGQLSNQDELFNKYQNSGDLDKIKDWTKEYNDLYETERDLKNETLQLGYSIEDLNNEVKKLELENKLEPFNNALDKSNSNISKLQNKLDILSIKFDNAYGVDKLKILKEQIKLNEQLALEQEKQLKAFQNKQSTYQGELKGYGFQFNSSGDITNLETALKKLENTGSYEYVKELIEEWKTLHEDEIPDAIKSIEEYEDAVRDSYNKQLDITKEIEDKMKAMIEKQIEDKKKAIEKETETVKKELEKQKRAYIDMRKEAEYKNDYNEKTDEISKLEKDLANAKKDTSLGNKKKIADLEKQLADAKKDLDKFVQDKLDSDIEQGFDDAIQNTEDKNNAKIEELEKIWTDSKIAETIKNSLSTGLFENIDGEVSNLQDALLEFAESSGEAFGVMGQVVKQELIANLGVALDTLKNYSTVLDGLGLNNINTNLPTGNISNKQVKVDDISININTASNAKAEDIGREVKKAVKDALDGVVQGL